MSSAGVVITSPGEPVVDFSEITGAGCQTQPLLKIKLDIPNHIENKGNRCWEIPFLFAGPPATASPVLWLFTRGVSAWNILPHASAGLSDSEEPSHRSLKSTTVDY